VIKIGEHYFFIWMRGRGIVRRMRMKILRSVFICRGTTHAVDIYLRGISLFVDVVVVAASTVVDLGRGGGGGLTSTCLSLGAVASEMAGGTTLDALVCPIAFKLNGCEGLLAWGLGAAGARGLWVGRPSEKLRTRTKRSQGHRAIEARRRWGRWRV
jgi:hypothetical protein